MTAAEKIRLARAALERAARNEGDTDEVLEAVTEALGLTVEALDEVCDMALAASERAGVPQDVEL